MATDSHSILARWRNHFSQLSNVHGVYYNRQTQIHTVEPLVHEPSVFEVDLAIEKLRVTYRQVLIKYQENLLTL